MTKGDEALLHKKPIAHDLNSLSDVAVASPAEAQVLTYEAATSLWKNKAGPGALQGYKIPHAFYTTNTYSGVTLTRYCDLHGDNWGSATLPSSRARVGKSKIVTAHLRASTWQALAEIYIYKNGAVAATLTVDASTKDWTVNLEFAEGDDVALGFYFDGIYSGTYTDTFEFTLDWLIG